VNWIFASGGQSIRASALVSVFLMNIQDWFPLGLTGLISLLFKGLSRVFPNTTVWKHQFFGTQPSLWSSSYIAHDYWKKHSFDCTDLWGQSDVSTVFGSIDISKIKGMNCKNVFSSFKNILPYFIYLFFFYFLPLGLTACRILVPRPGIRSTPSAVKPLDCQRSPNFFLFFIFKKTFVSEVLGLQKSFKDSST